MENHHLSEGNSIISMGIDNYKLWKITMLNGKTHYFDWAIFNSYVKLPECTPKTSTLDFCEVLG